MYSDMFKDIRTKTYTAPVERVILDIRLKYPLHSQSVDCIKLIDMINMVGNEKIDIRRLQFFSDCSDRNYGILHLFHSNNYLVSLNTANYDWDTHFEHDRSGICNFILAEALGYIYLGLIEPGSEKMSKQRKIEKESAVQYFATELLAPEGIVKEYMDTPVEQLAQKLIVPPELISMRLQTLYSTVN